MSDLDVGFQVDEFSRGVIPITVIVTQPPKPGSGSGIDGGGEQPVTPSPTPSVTVTPSVSPSAGPAPSPSVTPTATVTPTPSQTAGIVSASTTIAQELFDRKFRVMFGFVGSGSTISEQNIGSEKRRVGGWHIDHSEFTWKKWISLENEGVYNPYPGQLNPWSLKKWYKWGCRRFHLHNPFGMVPANSSQALVFEVDQYVNAKNGLTYNGQTLNTPSPWLVNDFVNVFRALTTGTRGRLDQATWDAWTIGPDAWFNPAEPIDVIIYIGALADPSGAGGGSYSTYIQRWQQYFNTNPKAAERRLRESVAPFISAYCRIAFDAAVVSPGPVPGDNVAITVQNRTMQRGWWSFWKWLESKIGKDRMYVESHPFKKGTGRPNPYLGYNVIADDDWSNSRCCPYTTADSGPHATSEMGDVQFIRAVFQGTSNALRNPLISSVKDGVRTLERYSFLENIDPSSIITVSSEIDPTISERRLAVANCCSANHNYYWYHLYPAMIAYHMLEQISIRGEPYPQKNITDSSLMVGNSTLQVLPAAFSGDTRYFDQFGYRFSTSTQFVQYLAMLIDKKKRADDSIFSS